MRTPKLTGVTYISLLQIFRRIWLFFERVANDGNQCRSISRRLAAGYKFSGGICVDSVCFINQPRNRWCKVVVELNNSIESLEEDRKSFESIMATIDLSARNQLSSSAVRRSRVESDLLQSLVDSDDAVEELMNLWVNERDADSAFLLREMEKECSPGLRQEEAILRDMISHYQEGWIEPMNRLAAVLYYQGKSEESSLWCSLVLRDKPWHFEAANVQLMNALRLGTEDGSKIIRMFRSLLPPIHLPRKRTWVERMSHEAILRIQEGRLITKQVPDDVRGEQQWQ
jgi:hypothetical protein